MMRQANAVSQPRSAISPDGSSDSLGSIESPAVQLICNPMPLVQVSADIPEVAWRAFRDTYGANRTVLPYPVSLPECSQPARMVCGHLLGHLSSGNHNEFKTQLGSDRRYTGEHPEEAGIIGLRSLQADAARLCAWHIGLHLDVHESSPISIATEDVSVRRIAEGYGGGVASTT